MSLSDEGMLTDLREWKMLRRTGNKNTRKRHYSQLHSRIMQFTTPAIFLTEGE